MVDEKARLISHKRTFAYDHTTQTLLQLTPFGILARPRGMNGKPLPGNDGSEGLQMIRPYSNSLPVLTPEQHAANQRKIEEARQRLANMEKQNEEGHRRFVQQELRKRVEEGERARSVTGGLNFFLL